MNEYATEYEVELVVCKDVLNQIPVRDKYSSFLVWWANIHQIKAVAVLEDWNNFVKDWETQLKDCSSEVRDSFIAFMRGIVTPYREKYADGVTGAKEIKLEGSSVDKLCQIVNRHYATVKYLIVTNPSLFVGKELKISQGQILTPKGLYSQMEVQAREMIDQFEKNQAALYP